MLGIVVPVYNEGKNIKSLFDEIESDISIPKQVMIVYDSPDDDTLPVVERIRGEYTFIIDKKANKYGRGALNAIKTGLEDCKQDVLLVMMADLSDNLNVVDSMYEKIVKDGYDIVNGSRYMKGGKQHGGGALKTLFSRTAGLSLHFLTGIPTHDVTNSFKMYRKSMLDSLTIESSGGFEIGLEIVVKAYIAGYRITELPSEWNDRVEGKSNFKMWEWIPHYLHWYMLCMRETFFRVFRHKSRKADC